MSVRDHLIDNKYGAEPDEVMGAGMGDAAPWLRAAGKMVGGFMGGQTGGGGDQQAAAQQQMMAMQAAQAQAERERQAKTKQTLTYVLLGALGLVAIGGLVYVLKK